MRIVYNLRDQDWQTTKSLGILHVSTRILVGLAESSDVACIDVLANSSLASRLAPLERTGKCRLHFAGHPAPRGWRRVWWDHWALVRACDRLAPDWLLLPKGFSPLGAWPRAPVSAYVHDNVFGYYQRRGLRPFSAGQAALFARMFRRTATRAKAIVTNSGFTATEFQRDFHPRRAPVRIGAPVEPISAGPHAGPGSSLFFHTSPWPHKLTRQAIAWLQRWTDEHRFTGGVQGVGALPSETPWPANAGWHHHGRVDDDTLTRLENEAAILIYFSDYEGYGLPPVEAAAAGRRAIASDLPPLRETMPGASLFNNADYHSFDQALTSALAAPPRPPLLIERAPEVAARWLAALRRSDPR